MKYTGRKVGLETALPSIWEGKINMTLTSDQIYREDSRLGNPISIVPRFSEMLSSSCPCRVILPEDYNRAFICFIFII